MYNYENGVWKKQDWNPTLDIVRATSAYCVTSVGDHEFRLETTSQNTHKERFPPQPIISLYYEDNMLIAQSETTLFIYKSFEAFNWLSSKPLIEFRVDINRKRVENVTICKNKVFILCCSDFVINYQETRLSDIDLFLNH